jgi:hypothetical protein
VISLSAFFLCHSERSEESRIFFDADYCTLIHGATAVIAKVSKRVRFSATY